jgi:cobalt-zinc-cadmium efflux system outer membrane protein
MPQPPTIKKFTVEPREVKWTLGPMLELELPIFDQNQAQVAKAVHEYNQKLAEYQQRAQEIIRDIRNSLLRRRQARQQVEFYRSAILPDVERNLALARQSFVAGQESLTVYLESQEDVVMTRLRMLEFLRDYMVSGVDLERAVGGSLTEPAATSEPAPESGEEHADLMEPDGAGQQ